MQDLNFTRFRHLLEHDLTVNRRSFTRFLVGIFIGTFLFIYLTTTAFHLHDFSQHDADREVLVEQFTTDLTISFAFLSFAFQLLCHIAASHIFSNMSTKQERIAFLMLPATNLEKFVVRWIEYVVFPIVAILLCMLAADLLCAIIRLPFGFPFKMVVESTIGLFGSIPSTKEWGMPCIIVLTSITSFSIYVLGGTVFRRLPYIMTSIVCGSLGIILLIFFSIFALFFADSIFAVVSDVSLNVEVIYAFICLTIIFATHWASYHMFCNSSAIGHKRVGM